MTAYRSVICRLLPMFVLSMILLTGSLAQAWEIRGGLVRSDAGLTETRDGMVLGISEIFAGRDRWLDFSFGMDYVQKGGSYERVISDGTTIPYIGPSRVRLHVLEPSLNLGLKLPDGMIVPRIFAGVAYGLKLGETWENADVASEDALYAYEDQDVVLQAGLSLSSDRVSLQLTYAAGLGTPLIYRGSTASTPTGKAEGSVDEIDTSGKMSSWRATVGWTF